MGKESQKCSDGTLCEYKSRRQSPNLTKILKGVTGFRERRYDMKYKNTTTRRISWDLYSEVENFSKLSLYWIFYNYGIMRHFRRINILLDQYMIFWNKVFCTYRMYIFKNRRDIIILWPLFGLQVVFFFYFFTISVC